ncbi:hypothetical protein ACQ86O_08910 [Serratia sp. L9]|uniref:hypothetical protein n=1 Tax=Serratia sp. L9 TaxID=3423946 RepID=UPI003D67B4DD
MTRSNTGDVGPNVVVVGSDLRASTADGLIVRGGLPNTWCCMGNMNATNHVHRTTLWMKVS